MSEPMHGQFRRELEEIINRNGIDTFLCAPDFLIADWICKQIAAEEHLRRAVEVWKGEDK